MKKIFFLFLICILSYPAVNILGQSENKVEVIIPQGTNKTGDYESIFYPHRKLNKMPIEKEKVLLKFHSISVRNKLEELKKISIDKYYEMLWYLAVPIPNPQKVSKHDEAYLDGVVTTSGPDSPERTKSNILLIDTELLAVKYRTADDQLKRNIENKLRDELIEFFQLRLTRIQQRVKDAEEKLNQLNTQLNSIGKNKEQIVTRRLEELINEVK